MSVRLADVCVLAVADCFRGDGDILANPIGTIPMIGGRLARATFEPDLMMTDGEAMLVSDDRAFFGPDDSRVIEAYNPYRSMFDVVWSGRRHVMMGASQIDSYGNQNFAPSHAAALAASGCVGERGRRRDRLRTRDSRVGGRDPDAGRR
jgi:acyl CoA:acetate/3-ketoacid CoA transferase beta subunit